MTRETDHYFNLIQPTREQAEKIDYWLELLTLSETLREHRYWNYALGQRYDYLRRTRSQADRCSLVSESIGEIPDPINYYTQQAALKETKSLFSDYKEIYSEVQQINLQRLGKAWKRWRMPDKKGKRGDRLELILVPPFGEPLHYNLSHVSRPVLFGKIQDFQPAIAHPLHHRNTRYLAPARDLYRRKKNGRKRKWQVSQSFRASNIAARIVKFRRSPLSASLLLGRFYADWFSLVNPLIIRLLNLYLQTI